MSTDQGLQVDAPFPEQIAISNMSELEGIDDTSYISSVDPSRRTTRLAQLFPTDTVRFDAFPKSSKILLLLRNTMKLDATFIA